MKRKTQDPRIAQKVIEMVAAYYKITPDDVKTEEAAIRIPRQVIMFILKEELGATLRVAKEAVNIKADMTVYMACKAIKALLKTDTALASKIEEIKAEALMIAATPGSEPPDTGASKPTSYRRQAGRAIRPIVPQSEQRPVTVSGRTGQIISNVQKAVTGVFLGSDLLQNPDPAGQVLLAKDTVVFLVWEDFSEIPLPELLIALHLEPNDLFRAIGKMSVGLKEPGNGIKKKLKAVRAAYTPA